MTLEFTETEKSELEREVMEMALTDVLRAAVDFFATRPDVREFTVEFREDGDGPWVRLPGGSWFSLLPEGAES